MDGILPSGSIVHRKRPQGPLGGLFSASAEVVSDLVMVELEWAPLLGA